MKILLLTDQQNTDRLSEYYSGLHKAIGSVDLRRLSISEQGQLKSYFSKSVNLSKYDRIVLHLDFSYLKPQLRFLRSLPNLVFLDKTKHYQGVRSKAKYYQYLKFYKKMPWVRIVVSNYHSMKQLQNEGLDAWCVPPGYNQERCERPIGARTIDLAMIGNGSVRPNPEQQSFTLAMKTKYPEMVFIAGDEIEGFERELGQFKSVVLPDIGNWGYRAKTFAAMASGCLVYCYEQDIIDTDKLGFRDGENIVLFRGFESFEEKHHELVANPQKAQAIAAAGQTLAQSKYRHFDLGREVANYIAAEMREPDEFRTGLQILGIRF